MTAARTDVKACSGMTAVAGVGLIAAVFLLLGLTFTPAAKADWIDGYEHQYQGRIIESSTFYVGFDRKKDKVSKFSVIVPVVCDSTHGVGIPLPLIASGKHKVRNDRLKVNKKLKLRIPGGGMDGVELNGKLNINLKFSGKGKKKVTGTIKPSFTFKNDSERMKCAFGKVDLKARKGARVTPTYL